MKLEVLEQRRAPWLLYIVGVIAISWALTLTLGTASIRPEMNSTVTSLAKNFHDTTLRVRSPVPFIISFRVQASGSLKGPETRYTLIKYYLWFFQFRRQIPNASVPGILTWVWLR